MVNDFDCDGINFPVSKKIMAELNRKILFINVVCYANDMVYPVFRSNKKFENCMDLLLITDESKLYYIYTKDFNRFMCNKTKIIKKRFCRYFLHCLKSEKVLQEHRKVCLKINSKESVKLNSGLIQFKNYFKQLTVPFKIFMLILNLF